MTVQGRLRSELPEPEQASAPSGHFDTPAVATIAAAHLANDTYPAFLGPLLPLIIGNLGITLGEAGGLATVYRACSLVQPFVGMWADKTDTRYLMVTAPTVTALAMSLVGIAPSYWSVAILLAVAGMGSSLFHPTATAAITRSSGKSWGKGLSIHMFGGEMGRSLGPMFIVSVITYFGLQQSWLAAIPGVMASVLLYPQLRKKRVGHTGGASVRGIWEGMKVQKRPLLLLGGLILFRSTSVQSFATFYATYLTDRGSSLMYGGVALSIYELAGGVGALFGGTLSDRLGRKTMMIVSQALSGPLLFLTLGLPDGTEALVVLGLAGALALSASPVQLALAQELLPGSRSTASGIVFLLGFEGTLVATLVVGVVADWIGLGPALGFGVCASMVSIPFTMALPETAGGK